jgi:hypothetical protein
VTRFEVDVEAIVARAGRMLMDMIGGTVIPPQTILMPPMDPEPDAFASTGMVAESSAGSLF